jgi:hypothetical protein
LYQPEPLLTTGDAMLEPMSYRIRQVHGLSAHMNPGQAVHTFEILNDVVVIGGAADLRDAKKADQFLLGHNGGTGTESAVRVWQDCRQLNVFLLAGHGGSLDIFCRVSTGTESDCREKKAEFRGALNTEEVLPVKER